MITGFSIHDGEPSATYTDATFAPGIPASIIELGHLMALEDYCHHGPVPRGYDQVKVTVWN